MKLQFPNKTGIALALGTVALGLGTFAFRAQADVWDKKTTFTVDQPIQIQDAYLKPGTYVLILADSSSDRHIVRIYDADQQHLIDTIFAIPDYRIQPTGRTVFTFWETPPGTAHALRGWFYPGDWFGEEFRYPAHLRQVSNETTTSSAPAQVVTPATQPPPATAQAAPAAPAPEPQALNQGSASQQTVNQEPANPEPPLVAQNTPPPAPEPQNTPPPAPPNSQQQLPQTATPYPFIGLCGLFSLGLCSVIRLTRSA